MRLRHDPQSKLRHPAQKEQLEWIGRWRRLLPHPSQVPQIPLKARPGCAVATDRQVNYWLRLKQKFGQHKLTIPSFKRRNYIVAVSKSSMLQIVFVIPWAMQGVALNV
jgi:hypothetical protein